MLRQPETAPSYDSPRDWILFSADTSGDGGNSPDTFFDRTGPKSIFAKKIESNGIVRLTKDRNVIDFDPIVSPDQKFIAFSRMQIKNPFQRPRNEWVCNLFLYSLENGSVQQITDFHPKFGILGCPTWSKDSDRIGFHLLQVSPGKASPDIWIVNLKDKVAHKVRSGAFPAWSPQDPEVMVITTEKGTVLLHLATNKMQYLARKAGANVFLPGGRKLLIVEQKTIEGRGPHPTSVLSMFTEVDMMTQKHQTIFALPQVVFGLQSVGDAKYLAFTSMVPSEKREHSDFPFYFYLGLIDLQSKHIRKIVPGSPDAIGRGIMSVEFLGYLS